MYIQKEWVTNNRVFEKRGRKILSKLLCTDDFGNLTYVSFWSKKIVSPADDSILLGAVVPQVSSTFLCAPEDKQKRIESVKIFNEYEANCNTCKHLERVPHEKRHGSSPLQGRCKKFKNPEHVTKHGAYLENGIIRFWAEDYMGMPCHEMRGTDCKKETG